jgi:hypothetical protein
MNKKIIICGVTDMDGKPVKKTKEEQEEFCKKMGGDDTIVIYDETNAMMPPLMKLFNKKNKK